MRLRTMCFAREANRTQEDVFFAEPLFGRMRGPEDKVANRPFTRVRKLEELIGWR